MGFMLKTQWCSAVDRENGEFKLHKHAIAGGLDHTTAVFSYFRVNKLTSDGL